MSVERSERHRRWLWHADSCHIPGSRTLFQQAPSATAYNIYYGSGAASSANNTTTTDANGNEITSTDGVYTDTLGQTALTIAGTAPSNTTLSYVNAAGSNESYKVTYQSYNIKTNFGCVTSATSVLPNEPISEYSATGVDLVSTIALPDGTYYQFEYEPTPGSSGYVTGRPASVKLPTGGTISYSYTGSNNGIYCVDGSAAGLTRTTPDGTWTYARGEGSGGSTTTVTAPAYGTAGTQSNTVIDFSTIAIPGIILGPGGAGYYETERQIYSGAISAANLVQTILHCYMAAPPNNSSQYCSTTTGDTEAEGTPFGEVMTTVQWPNSTGISSGTYDIYDSVGNQTSHAVYDYGAVGSGVYSTNPLQTTNTTYWTNPGNGTSFETSNPSEIKVLDAASTVISDTKYFYDGTAAIATGITVQHVVPTTEPGNLTSIERLVSGSTWQTATYTNNDTGTVASFTDFNGTNVTNYTYGDCNGGFLTGTSTPVTGGLSSGITLTSGATWNCVGGVPLTTTDANGNVTAPSYGSDPYWRPQSVTDPAGNITSYGYPTGSSPNTWSTSLSFNGGSSASNSVITTDGLGRTILQQTQQSPSSTSYDTVQTSYDALGRASYQSIPYASTAGTPVASEPGVTTAYNALNQVLTVTDGGGGTTLYTYPTSFSTAASQPGYDVYVTKGPATTLPAAESLKDRNLEYNGAGWLTSVCEVIHTTLPAGGACGQTSVETGYLTKYTYDGGRLTQTQQNVQPGSSGTQTRTLTYDLLGRKLSESIPEWSAGTGTPGTAAYVYDYIGGLASCLSSSAGDLVRSVDNAGNVTCYAYDSLHRLTQSAVIVVEAVKGLGG